MFIFIFIYYIYCEKKKLKMKSSSPKTTSQRATRKPLPYLTTLFFKKKKKETVIVEDDFTLKVILPPGDITHFHKKKFKGPLFTNKS